MAVVSRQRNVHVDCLETSTAISAYYVKNFIPPIEVIGILNAVNVRYMLAGTYGICGWFDEPRAAQVMEIVLGYRQNQRATQALLASYPRLQTREQVSVIRFADEESGRFLIDFITARQSLFRRGLKHVRTIEFEGESFKIPSLEMALAMKFRLIVDTAQEYADKHLAASDFINLVNYNKSIDAESLAELGELVHLGGGKEIAELVRKVRAKEKLQI